MARKITGKHYTYSSVQSFGDDMAEKLVAMGWTISRPTNSGTQQIIDAVSGVTINGETIKIRLYFRNSSSDCYLYTYKADELTIAQSIKYSDSCYYIRYQRAIVHTDAVVIYGDGQYSSVGGSVVVAAVGNIANWNETLGLSGVANLGIFYHSYEAGGRETMQFRKQRTLDTNGNSADNALCDCLTNYGYSYPAQTGDKKYQECDVQIRFSDGSVGIGGELRPDLLRKISNMNYDSNRREVEVIKFGTQDYILMKEASYSFMSEFSDIV